MEPFESSNDNHDPHLIEASEDDISPYTDIPAETTGAESEENINILTSAVHDVSQDIKMERDLAEVAAIADFDCNNNDITNKKDLNAEDYIKEVEGPEHVVHQV